MSDTNSVTHVPEGGIAALVLARGVNTPRLFDKHPQLLLIAADDVPDSLADVTAKIPSNTKVIVLGGIIPDDVFKRIKATAERRQIPYVTRRNASALSDTLGQWLKKGTNGVVPPDPAANGHSDESKVPIKGVTDLIRVHGDLTSGRSNADEARRLMEIALSIGLVTTFGSLTQGIAVAKRRGGMTTRPKSVRSEHDKVLTTFDEAIAGLQLVREYIADTEKENGELRAKIAAFKQLLGVGQ